jgi:hypothetical protein
MKKRTQCAAAALAALLAACTTRPPGGPEPVCADRVVTVTYAPGYLAAHPEHLEVCGGNSVVFKFAPRIEPGTARTQPARGQPDWLRSREQKRGEIMIVVPENTPYDTFKYEIVVDGIGKLDPRLTVSRH